ncbi:hypothetical protein PHLGIDRAFT_122688 [Phlebiopsis gigantea 11061_1 CR5-6]|uniref:C2H2-type domain-containing protein n=1 Tax=Phlebiopsis gigantea (strain 11061_1 CR5-6) TaxID=745531 RepID=A0A0C3RQN3_PHLG1|nr:hypothetical protein PHLGIDRAFT_122688 [Phlebiopsis gigantea 11061_1 CR5-6]
MPKRPTVGQLRLPRGSPWLIPYAEPTRKYRWAYESDEECDRDPESAVSDLKDSTEAADNGRRSRQDDVTVSRDFSNCDASGSSNDTAVEHRHDSPAALRIRGGIVSSSNTATTSSSILQPSTSSRWMDSSCKAPDGTMAPGTSISDVSSTYTPLCPLPTCRRHLSGSSRVDVKSHFDKYHAAIWWMVHGRRQLIRCPMCDKHVQKKGIHAHLASQHVRKNEVTFPYLCTKCGKRMLLESTLLNHTKRCGSGTAGEQTRRHCRS